MIDIEREPLKPRALFLVKCGRTNGLGHLRRSLILSNAMQSYGWTCSFGLSDLDAVPENILAQISAQLWIGAGLNLGPADIIVFDGYEISPEIYDKWKNRSQVSLKIDDHASEPREVEIVLNHNVYGNTLDYSNYCCSSILAGVEFSLIDPLFFSLYGNKKPSEKYILISFGNTDDGCFALPVASQILEITPDSIIDLAIPQIKQSNQVLKNLQKKYSGRINIDKSGSLFEAMSRASFYVGAGGVTALEAIASGVEPVLCSIVDNQKLNIMAFKSLGYATTGIYDASFLAQTIATKLKYKNKIPDRLIDDLGPKRIIEALKKHLTEET